MDETDDCDDYAKLRMMDLAQDLPMDGKYDTWETNIISQSEPNRHW